jgi:glycosyltransferase 2 family protein
MAQATPARPSRNRWLRRHALALVGSLVLGAGLVWLLHAGALPVVPDASAFAKVRWWTVPAYGLLWATMLVLRSSRWYLLLAPVHRVPLRRALAVGLIGYGAISLLPFRLGEVVRPALIRKRGELSFLAATGVVGAERVIDGLALSVTLLVALLFSHPVDPLPDHIMGLPISAAIVPRLAYSASFLFAALFVAMAVYYYWRDFARRTTLRVVGLISERAGTWLADAVERLADGLRFLPRWRYTAPFLALTAVYWFLFLCGAWILLWGAGIESPTLLESTVIMGVLALAVVPPNAPGFFGAFQISLYSGMLMFYPEREVTGVGSAFVFLIYLLQLGLTLLLGGVALAVEGLSASEVFAAEAPSPGEAT